MVSHALLQFLEPHTLTLLIFNPLIEWIAQSKTHLRCLIRKWKILQFDHKDLTSQMLKNEHEIIQSYEIVGSSSKKYPQLNEYCAPSKYCSTINTQDCKEIKDATSEKEKSILSKLSYSLDLFPSSSNHSEIKSHPLFEKVYELASPIDSNEIRPSIKLQD